MEEIFFVYAHKDERLRNQLQIHLSPLKGLISAWCDREIVAGMIGELEIDKHLNTASIILLLVSPDFMACDYCYSFEMKRALERHDAGEAHVIPVILRPVIWWDAPFGKLQVLPKNAKPVTTWSNRDAAFLDIAVGIRFLLVNPRNILMSSPTIKPSTTTLSGGQIKKSQEKELKRVDHHRLTILLAHSKNGESYHKKGHFSPLGGKYQPP